jgi:hypothetical protein
MNEFPATPAFARHRLLAARLRAELVALRAFRDRDVVVRCEPRRELEDGISSALHVELSSRTRDGAPARAVLLVDLLASGHFPLTPPVIAIIAANWPARDLTATLDAALARWTPESSSVAGILAEVARAAEPAVRSHAALSAA